MDLNSLIASSASGAQPSVAALFQLIFDLFWRLVIDRIKTLRAPGANTPLIQFRLGALCVVRLVELHLTLRHHPERFTSDQLLPLREAAPILERLTGAPVDFSPLDALAEKNKPKSHPAPHPTIHSVHSVQPIHSVPVIPEVSAFSEDAALLDAPSPAPSRAPSAYTILETLYPCEGPVRCTAWTAPGKSLAELCTLVAHILFTEFPTTAPQPQTANPPKPCSSEIPPSSTGIPYSLFPTPALSSPAPP